MSNETIEPTVYDSSTTLERLDKKPMGSYPEEFIRLGKEQTLVSEMETLIRDVNPRHLAKVIAAKGFLPYYDPGYKKLYAQIFGFQRQFLKENTPELDLKSIILEDFDKTERYLSEIKEETLSEALVSNLYAAMDHIYWVFGELTGEAFSLLEKRNSLYLTDDSLEHILKDLNCVSSKILRSEEAVLSDKKVMEQIGAYVEQSFNFSRPVIDRSWRNNPHWNDFDTHFTTQHKKVKGAIYSVGLERMNKYPDALNVLQRLDRYK